ncbi:unnamed protein product [Effrenium voratum]|uniref:SET domain-containing protein n=1 Tax=Effrenium voratum TaxID=2562239 RepID=A0AA36IY99_9DINO|nr:unnamed protein product [Effrenium voratum]
MQLSATQTTVVLLHNLSQILSGLIALDIIVAAMNNGEDVCNESSEVYDLAACESSVSHATRANAGFQFFGGIMSVLTIPMVGDAADRFGRKPLFVLALVLAEVPSLLLLCVSCLNLSIYAFLAASIVDQVVPMPTLFSLWINDCTAQNDRVKIYARLSAFQSMEGIVVPLAAKLLSGKTAVLLLVALRLATLLTGCFLTESLPQRSPDRLGMSESWAAFATHWRNLPKVCAFKATRSIFLLGFVATGTGAATQSILLPFCKARFGLTSSTFAPLLTVETVSNGFVQLLITPRLARCCSLRCLFAVGLSVGGLNLLNLALAPSFRLMTGLASIAGFGSVGTPAFQTLTANFADQAGQASSLQSGAVLSALQGIQSLFLVLMPPVYQMIFSVCLSSGYAQAPFLLAALSQLICLMILLRFKASHTGLAIRSCAPGASLALYLKPDTPKQRDILSVGAVPNAMAALASPGFRTRAGSFPRPAREPPSARASALRLSSGSLCQSSLLAAAVGRRGVSGRAPRRRAIFQPEGQEEAWQSFIAVEELEGKGFGVVATRRLRRGELVLRERPLLGVPGSFEAVDLLNRTSLGQLEEDLQAALRQLSAELRRSFWALSDCHGDTKTAAGVALTNALHLGEGGGILPISARFNHSCVPNIQGTWADGCAEWRVLREVEEGEELCFSYVEPYQPQQERQRTLEQLFRFRCNCPACRAGESSDLRRLQLKDLLEALQLAALAEEVGQLARDLVPQMLELIDEELAGSPALKSKALHLGFLLALEAEEEDLAASMAGQAWQNAVLAYGPESDRAKMLEMCAEGDYHSADFEDALEMQTSDVALASPEALQSWLDG